MTDILDRTRKHLQQMPTHVSERASAKLLEELVNELQWARGRPQMKITLHWLRAAFDRVAMGEPEEEVMLDFGYTRSANADLLSRVEEFDRCIQRIATELGGVCCGGVDGDQSEVGSTTAVIVAAIRKLRGIQVVAQAADDLMATLGAEGAIDTRHPKTQILLDALYEWRHNS